MRQERTSAPKEENGIGFLWKLTNHERHQKGGPKQSSSTRGPRATFYYYKHVNTISQGSLQAIPFHIILGIRPSTFLVGKCWKLLLRCSKTTSRALFGHLPKKPVQRRGLEDVLQKTKSYFGALANFGFDNNYYNRGITFYTKHQNLMLTRLFDLQIK